MIDNEKRRAVKGYLWVVRNPDNGEVFFIATEVPVQRRQLWFFFMALMELTQSDGYQVYNRFEALDGKLMLGCWAHARRKSSMKHWQRIRSWPQRHFFRYSLFMR